MSRSGDPYGYDDDPPRRHRHHHHSDREPRYVETEETYVRGSGVPYAPDAPYSRQTDLIRRPVRQDSDLSIEEVRREFPPPVAGVYTSRSLRADDRYGPSVRSRSADRHSQYRDDDRSRTSETYEDKKVETRRRSLSRNQKILAAVGGAALAVGGKELWDRRQASSHDRPVSRNALSSAAIGAAGAFAAYEGAEFISKRRAKTEKVKTYTAHRGRNGEVTEHYTSSEEEKPKSRRKSLVEGALGLAGLGGAAAAAKGSGDKNKKDGEHKGAAKFQQAAKAALLAGATEAFRVRKEPGGWGGAKGKRILTAAIGAGGIDAAADRNPDVHSKRHILEAVVGGLAGNRLINGSRHDVEAADKRSRSRARSRARSQSRGGEGGGGLGSGAGLAALATAGLGALAGKKFLDDKREKSREREEKSRERSPSRSRRKRSDSYDSRSPSPKNKRSRSKSVTDYARKGLAALGIGEAAHEAGRSRDRSRDREVVEEEEIIHRRRRGSDDDHRRRRHRESDEEDDYRDDRRSRRHGSSRDDVYEESRHSESRRSVDAGRRDKDRRRGKDKGDESDSSLGSSSGDEKRAKKMKGKQLLTMGLATVATIHAAHNVYQSMEKREARKKAVREGQMSPEEARKLKSKAVLQDAASIGIAALGIKGAISEIKEANELRRECREFREKKEQRHQKRLERLQKDGGGSGRRRNESDQSPPRGRIDYGPPPDYADEGQYGRQALMTAPVGYSNGR
ncbi:hypothetical protein OIDMADRAFT_28030 [Oidiodendron maius Zn]|uniref:DUF3824 domain-containing protein n=1 Tax=Oidiodendron maius (strain Zn) TaxID=913774 RepID=A0A0C3HHS0_OIDMZ|nr:hypothetical protein OIDMADRAFT_28030 [Oidiodendron maius Zn]